jgi:hypothetical protein
MADEAAKEDPGSIAAGGARPEEPKPEIAEPSAKRPRTEQDEPNGTDIPTEKASASVEPGEIPEEPAMETAGTTAPASEPLKIGYRTFASGKDCAKYYHDVLVNYRKNQNLNDYEFHNIIELIRHGHPDASRKLGDRVVAVQVRELWRDGRSSQCFHLLYQDKRVEDVSYLKCVGGLFPDYKEEIEKRKLKRSERVQSGKGGSRRGGNRGRR